MFKNLVEDFILTNDIEKDSYNFLLKHNRLVIAEHSLRVANRAKLIAKQYGFDEDLAYEAGLLHDIGGVFANEERIEIAKILGLSILPEEEMFPLILHQKISEVMAKEIFNVYSYDVLSAIGCHTTLKQKASFFDMILFVADKIEWDQKGMPPYLKEIEETLDISIELAAFTYLKYQWNNKEKLKVIHPWLLAAYKDLEERLKI